MKTIRKIKDWITEGFTGKRYVMGQYRKVSSRKPMRIAAVYVVMLAILTGVGAIISALM